jgi:hypothetical protein
MTIHLNAKNPRGDLANQHLLCLLQCDVVLDVILTMLAGTTPPLDEQFVGFKKPITGCVRRVL